MQRTVHWQQKGSWVQKAPGPVSDSRQHQGTSGALLGCQPGHPAPPPGLALPHRSALSLLALSTVLRGCQEAAAPGSQLVLFYHAVDGMVPVDHSTTG